MVARCRVCFFLQLSVSSAHQSFWSSKLIHVSFPQHSLIAITFTPLAMFIPACPSSHVPQEHPSVKTEHYHLHLKRPMLSPSLISTLDSTMQLLLSWHCDITVQRSTCHGR
ncbi:uncharacterized protein EDB93DRAFT_732274 [Suillus bovinus]|uniref:uncharacterized protein n=1 Tax=Suillus bovinus TaxID=48563 RepID=UPI001B872E91|nr:uncharacterized protein EDB93DRAFT_732274 [Suillus bovinus]KAG2157893.1 hypothetical protein EDB93DRAFT_732274 [Suillus bovinus]